MNWGGVSGFIAMGGYGFYVWGSYVVASVLIGIEIGGLILRHHKAKRELQP